MDALTSREPDQLPPSLWRALADQLPQLAWITDRDGHAIWFNKRSSEFLGIGLDELVGEGWGNAIHPDALPSVIAAWQRAVAAGTSYEAHYPLRQHDGGYRDFLARAEPHRGADGEIEYWFGTSTDVTEERAVQERARLAADEIETIYATAPVGLTVLDKDMRFVRINARMAEINGIPAADHIGKSVRELLPDLADQAESALRRVFAGEEILGLELMGETPAKPGIVRTWRENWLPVRSATGEITSVAISAEETTAAKEADSALARSEAQFRTLAEAIPGMLFITDSDGANRYVNATFASFSGLAKEQLLGRGWLQLLHPDDRDRTWAAWAEAKASDRPYEVEYRLCNHVGDFRWIAARALRWDPLESTCRHASLSIL